MLKNTHFRRIMMLAVGLITALLLVSRAYGQPGKPGNSPTDPSLTPAPCDLAWRIVNGPPPNNSEENLFGVAARAVNDVWAVGDYTDRQNIGHSLVEHYDGRSWQAIPSPSPNETLLDGVVALAANDVWAVGNYYSDAQGRQPIALHWDGSTWQVVPTQSTGSRTNFLRGVTAVAANDIWAVGDYVKPDLGSQTLIEHWNGQQWQIVPSANESATSQNLLYGVAAASATDIWAVGLWYLGDNHDLIEHWDGQQWRVVPSPDVSGMGLRGVTALARNNVWAVGDLGNSSTALHWDGFNWQMVETPWSGRLYAVAGSSAHDVWAVGSGPGASPPFATHWDGTVWSLVPAAIPSSGVGSLSGVSVLPDHSAWAVGQNGIRPLIEHYSTLCAPTKPQ